MASNQKAFTFDAGLLLKDTGAVIASGNATVASVAKVVDVGAARVDARAIFDVSAIDTVTGDESYVLQVQGSNSSTFASSVVALASKQLGGATPTGNTAATGTGRFELPFSNEENGVTYRYLRHRYVIAGTTPSITVNVQECSTTNGTWLSPCCSKAYPQVTHIAQVVNRPMPSDATPAAAAQGAVRAKLLSSSDTWRCGSAPLAKGQP